MTPAILEQWPLLLAGGFVVGLLVGLTGVGAGSLTTPMLITGFGVPPAIAVGTDLLFASITKASAAWRHEPLGNVDWSILRPLMAGSIPGALAVLAWLHVGKPDTEMLAKMIRSGLTLALLVSAAAIVFYPWIASHRIEIAPSHESGGKRTRSTIGLGAILGCLVALTSVGAGAIGVVALISLYPALIIRRVVGTDIVHAIPLTLVSGMGPLSLGNVDLGLLLTLLAGSIPGIAIGSRATGQLSETVLRVLLACVLLVAAWMIFPTWT